MDADAVADLYDVLSERVARLLRAPDLRRRGRARPHGGDVRPRARAPRPLPRPHAARSDGVGVGHRPQRARRLLQARPRRAPCPAPARARAARGHRRRDRADRAARGPRRAARRGRRSPSPGWPPSSARRCACGSSTSSTIRPSRAACGSPRRRRGPGCHAGCAGWRPRWRNRHDRTRAERDPRRVRTRPASRASAAAAAVAACRAAGGGRARRRRRDGGGDELALGAGIRAVSELARPAGAPVPGRGLAAARPRERGRLAAERLGLPLRRAHDRGALPDRSGRRRGPALRRPAAGGRRRPRAAADALHAAARQRAHVPVRRGARGHDARAGRVPALAQRASRAARVPRPPGPPAVGGSGLRRARAARGPAAHHRSASTRPAVPPSAATRSVADDPPYPRPGHPRRHCDGGGRGRCAERRAVAGRGRAGGPGERDGQGRRGGAGARRWRCRRARGAHGRAR